MTWLRSRVINSFRCCSIIYAGNGAALLPLKAGGKIDITGTNAAAFQDEQQKQSLGGLWIGMPGSIKCRQNTLILSRWRVAMQATSQSNYTVSNLAEQIKGKIDLETRNSQEFVVQQVCKKLFLSKVSQRKGNLMWKFWIQNSTVRWLLIVWGSVWEPRHSICSKQTESFLEAYTP